MMERIKWWAKARRDDLADWLEEWGLDLVLAILLVVVWVVSPAASGWVARIFFTAMGISMVASVYGRLKARGKLPSWLRFGGDTGPEDPPGGSE